RGSIEGKGTPFKTNPVAPRLGITYDIMGDHKTIIKAHYGHYYEAMLGSYFSLLDDRADQILQLYYTPAKQWVTLADTPHIYSINPDIKHPYVQQFTVGVDRELPWQVAFGGHYIDRKWKNIIEDVNTTGQYVPVVITNPATGQPITVYNQLNPGDN